MSLNNLKIELERPAEVSPGSESYAKIIGAVDNARGQTGIRFTLVAPAAVQQQQDLP